MTELARELLLDRSGLRDLNRPSSSIVGASHRWRDLDEEGRRLQSRLLREIDTLAPLVETMLANAPNDAKKKLAKAQDS